MLLIPPPPNQTCRFTFATGSADNVKKWKYPNGDFMLNFDPHNTVVNAMAVNSEGVCVTGGVCLWSFHVSGYGGYA